jgi:hypothetical protein
VRMVSGQSSRKKVYEIVGLWILCG